MADSFAQTPCFRETQPADLWSARLTLRLPYADFKHITSRTAQNNGQSYTGFITKDDNGNVTSFTRTRYPRKKYGIASIEACQAGMVTLANELNAIMKPDPQTKDFRVALGLFEGYGDQNPQHSPNEVQQLLPWASILPAEIFALRFHEETTSIYSEPVAIISGPSDRVAQMYSVAENLKQERFTVEDFDKRLAYVVETRFCKEPD